jgi:hypothetical protein
MTLIDPQRHALIAGGTGPASNPKPLVSDPLVGLPLFAPPFRPLPSPP